MLNEPVFSFFLPSFWFALLSLLSRHESLLNSYDMLDTSHTQRLLCMTHAYTIRVPMCVQHRVRRLQMCKPLFSWKQYT